MRTSTSVPSGRDPSGALGGVGHCLAAFTIDAALGVALGLLLTSLLRAGRLRWSWASLALLGVIVVRSQLSGAAPTLAIAASTTMLRARRLHRAELDAGADLADAARRRWGPWDLLRWTINTCLLRRRRRGARGTGRWFRGDQLIIGRDARGGLVSIPFGGPHGGSHALLVGATGSGKTVTQTWMAMRAIERGMAAVVVDPKGDPALRTTLARAARAAHRPFLEWTPTGPSVYNPFARGFDTEIADKLLAGERFTEPHYLRQAQRFIGHVVRVLGRSARELSLATIVEHLDTEALERLARQLPEEEGRLTHHYLDGLTAAQRRDLAGVRDRLAVVVESDVGPWLDPSNRSAAQFDLLAAVQQQAVVYFNLDADSRPLLTQMLGAAIVQDLQTTVATLQGTPIPTLVVLDEFSAIAAEQVVRLFGRARSAGFSVVLSTQELADLRVAGDETLLDRVMGNLSVLLAHRQVVPKSAELVSIIAGTRGAWRVSQHSGGRSTRTRARERLLAPDAVTSLGPGSLAALVLGGRPDARIARVFMPQRASGREEAS